MREYILALDQGTTSTRAIIFDKQANICAISQKEVKCFYPQNGYVEQDPLEIWGSVVDAMSSVLIKMGLTSRDISCIGITNQRETTILFDKITKKPVYNAIVWQSRQSKYLCDDLINKGYKDLIKEKTGLLINPYFSATKIKWIIDNVEGVKELYEQDRLLFGTVDTWLIYNLTNGKVHATDVTNASRTMLFNIHEQKWDDELIEILGLKRSLFPEVKSCSELYGYADHLSPFGETTAIAITGVAGDQQASLFGHCCFNEGDVKNTYGTGCFMLLNTGNKAVSSNNGLLTTIAYKINGETIYALEGSVFVAGSVVQWIRDSMRMINQAGDSEEYCMRVKDTNGVYVVPAFVGLGTPYWDDEARGAVFGITRATTKEHFIRASIESIAYQNKDVLNVMTLEAGIKLTSLYADGGATANNFLMQFQADILGVIVQLPKIKETTALGACYLAGLGANIFKDLDEIKKLHHIDKTLYPTFSEEEINARYKDWLKAIKATRTFE